MTQSALRRIKGKSQPMSSDPSGSFTTHANYLRAIASQSELVSGSTQSSALARLVPQAVANVQGGKASSPDLAQTRRSLANAWATETVLRFAFRVANEEELVRISNHWGVVQLYYVAYHLTQSLAAAKGFPRPTTHPKTQNLYRDFWCSGSTSILPWSLASDVSGFLNLPSGTVINDQLHPWTACTPQTQLDLAGKAIRTTRDDLLREARSSERDRLQKQRRAAWVAAHPGKPVPHIPRPRLTTADTSKLEKRVGMRGLIDYLYRLRIKTNYEDPMTFTEGPSNSGESEIVLRDLVYIASATAMVNEVRLMSLIGRSRVLGWMKTWSGRNMPSGWAKTGLTLRAGLY